MKILILISMTIVPATLLGLPALLMIIVVADAELPYPKLTYGIALYMFLTWFAAFFWIRDVHREVKRKSE